VAFVFFVMGILAVVEVVVVVIACVHVGYFGMMAAENFCCSLKCGDCCLSPWCENNSVFVFCDWLDGEEC